MPLLVLVCGLASASPQSGLSGRWVWKGELAWQRLALDLTTEGTRVRGTISMGPGMVERTASPSEMWEYFFSPAIFEITSGTIRANVLSLEHKAFLSPHARNEFLIRYSGRLEDGRLLLSVELRGTKSSPLGVRNHKYSIAMERAK